MKVKVSRELIEDAITSLLYSLPVLENKKDILSVRLPVKAKDGLVEVTVNLKESN